MSNSSQSLQISFDWSKLDLCLKFLPERLREIRKMKLRENCSGPDSLPDWSQMKESLIYNKWLSLSRLLGLFFGLIPATCLLCDPDRFSNRWRWWNRPPENMPLCHTDYFEKVQTQAELQKKKSELNGPICQGNFHEKGAGIRKRAVTRDHCFLWENELQVLASLFTLHFLFHLLWIAFLPFEALVSFPVL